MVNYVQVKSSFHRCTSKDMPQPRAAHVNLSCTSLRKTTKKITKLELII